MSSPNEGFQLREKVLALSETILAKHPMMLTLLREIHTTLRQYPENVTLMTEEEIQIIVSGLKLQTNTEFVQAAIGSGKSTAVKNIKKLGLDAF